MDDLASANNNKPHKGEANEKPGLQKFLKDVVKRNETDEKLDELASKISGEWKQPRQSRKKPDLSFAKFQYKLKGKKG